MVEAGVFMSAGAYIMDRFQRNSGARPGCTIKYFLMSYSCTFINLVMFLRKLANILDHLTDLLHVSRPGHARMDQLKQVIRVKLEEKHAREEHDLLTPEGKKFAVRGPGNGKSSEKKAQHPNR